MNTLSIMGLIILVLMAPHLTKRESIVIMLLNFFIGVVLHAYEVFK